MLDRTQMTIFVLLLTFCVRADAASRFASCDFDLGAENLLDIESRERLARQEAVAAVGALGVHIAKADRVKELLEKRSTASKKMQKKEINEKEFDRLVGGVDAALRAEFLLILEDPRNSGQFAKVGAFDFHFDLLARYLSRGLPLKPRLALAAVALALANGVFKGDGAAFARAVLASDEDHDAAISRRIFIQDRSAKFRHFKKPKRESLRLELLEDQRVIEGRIARNLAKNRLQMMEHDRRSLVEIEADLEALNWLASESAR